MVFWNVDFHRSDNGWYFNVNNNSFIISDLCINISKLICNGKYENHSIKKINALWLNPTAAELIDNRIMKSVIRIKCGDINEAQRRVKGRRDAESEVTVNCKRLLCVNKYKAGFRIWCPVCRHPDKYLRRNCTKCNSPARVYWFAKTELDISYKSSNHRQFRISEVNIDMDTVGQMYEYCSSNGVSSPELWSIIRHINLHSRKNWCGRTRIYY